MSPLALPQALDWPEMQLLQSSNDGCGSSTTVLGKVFAWLPAVQDVVLAVVDMLTQKMMIQKTNVDN